MAPIAGPDPARERRFLGVLVGWLALRRLLGVVLGLGFLGALFAISIPGFVGFKGQARVAELSTVLHQIRTAERAWEAEHDVFLPVPMPVPVAPTDLSGEQHPWPSSSPFAELEVDPGVPVRGTYWVEVSEDAHSFVAHGLMDLDGDGEPLHWTATEDRDPEPLPADQPPFSEVL